jgi:glycerophosphoryl diester phosphodiesterase
MGQAIPTLGEVLDAVPPGYTVFVELKEESVAEPAYRVVAGKGRLGDTVFISFLPEALRRVRSLDPGARLGFNIGSLEDLQRLWRLHEELGLYSADPPIEGLKIVGREMFAELLREARKAGMKIAVWTVNDPQLLGGLEQLIDYVMTDDPTLWPQRRSCSPQHK